MIHVHIYIPIRHDYKSREIVLLSLHRIVAVTEVIRNVFLTDYELLTQTRK